MVTNIKVYGKAMPMPIGIGLGTAVSLLVTMIGCAALAVLLDHETIGREAVGYGAMVVLMLASFLGSASSVGMVKRRKMMVCLIQTGCFLSLLLLINGLLFGGSVSGLWVTALLLLGGAGCALLFGNERNGKKTRLQKKWHTG